MKVETKVCLYLAMNDDKFIQLHQILIDSLSQMNSIMNSP